MDVVVNPPKEGEPSYENFTKVSINSIRFLHAPYPRQSVLTANKMISFVFSGKKPGVRRSEVEGTNDDSHIELH